MITVAIIGCGNIGAKIAEYLKRDKRFFIVALVDKLPENFIALSKKLNRKFPVINIKDAVRKADFIIEAAGKEAVREILECKGLDKPGNHLLVMSTGGLSENFSLLKKIVHCKIHIPPGAIAGLDAIHAAKGKIQSLSLTTTKPVAGLKGTPYLVKNNIALSRIKSQKKIFQGNLQQAVKAFPQNINVAASLFLASQFKGIKISIVADAKTKYNTHEVVCRGDFGTIHTVTTNRPSNNPKTSYLAILSAIAAVKSRAENISIGN